MPMMHPEDEANTDAPLVPDLRGTNRDPTTAPPTGRPADGTGRPGPAAPYANEPDPLQPHLGAIGGNRAWTERTGSETVPTTMEAPR